MLIIAFIGTVLTVCTFVLSVVCTCISYWVVYPTGHAGLWCGCAENYDGYTHCEKLTDVQVYMYVVRGFMIVASVLFGISPLVVCLIAWKNYWGGTHSIETITCVSALISGGILVIGAMILFEIHVHGEHIFGSAIYLLIVTAVLAMFAVVAVIAAKTPSGYTQITE